jgi:hypothetical protein
MNLLWGISEERKSKSERGFNQENKKALRPVEIVSSEIIYMDLYPNQLDLVNKIRISLG